MYKNQLQELAQRSCFNLPSYTCIREGPDHAPRFKATVNFNGETFESPHYCSTLRQAEHSAAEVALNSLSNRGPSHSLAARILDETGVYKNLLQEIAQRVGAPLPQYTTFRSGLGHLPVFTGVVELARITFTGEPAKNKKQAEKNAAMAAWNSLKQLAKEAACSSSEPDNSDELEQITIARALQNYKIKEMSRPNSSNAPIPFTKKFQSLRPTSPQPLPSTTSKILPLIFPKAAPRNRSLLTTANDKLMPPAAQAPALDGRGSRPQRFPAAGAAPYVPIRQFRTPCHSIAPPVTIRTAVPVFSAPPHPPPSAVSAQPSASAHPAQQAQSLLPSQPPPSALPPQQLPSTFQPPPSALPPQQSPPTLPHKLIQGPCVRIAPPVTVRQVVPVFAAPLVGKENVLNVRKEDAPTSTPAPAPPAKSPAQVEEAATTTEKSLEEFETVQSIVQLKI
ncbi:hypothetical protein SLEP1_g13788 [Rubroshorea leprosula]|uniref:DRBM domain-containing protein n=1 Tax=Rubroshorea leprosula TaxID=152421 RepID=A0AAV5IMU2_9ROSI|nr:hypothetical protein SLEP1_g13788 [Rubroshorea leprosula]